MELAAGPTSNKWIAVGAQTYDTMSEGKASLKKMEGGKWKWAVPSGDCVTQSRFVCNAHVECSRMLRVYLSDGRCIIQGMGEHASQANMKRRLNSTLSFDMESRVRESMDQGGKSAGLLVALTNTKVMELKEQGLDPDEHKEEEGGLIGALKPAGIPEYMPIQRIGCIPCVSKCI
jgi:hypothetical protein